MVADNLNDALNDLRADMDQIASKLTRLKRADLSSQADVARARRAALDLAAKATAVARDAAFLCARLEGLQEKPSTAQRH